MGLCVADYGFVARCQIGNNKRIMTLFICDSFWGFNWSWHTGTPLTTFLEDVDGHPHAHVKSLRSAKCDFSYSIFSLKNMFLLHLVALMLIFLTLYIYLLYGQMKTKFYNGAAFCFYHS